MSWCTPGLFWRALPLLLTGCEIFLPDVGGKGEPCAESGACDDGLACNFGECVEPLQEGENCDMQWIRRLEQQTIWNNDRWQDWYAVCAPGLCCTDGVCRQSSPAIANPITGLEWMRCPLGSSWERCYCSLENQDELDYPSGYKEYTDSAVASGSMCPEGYRIPTKEEALDLFDNCDTDVPNTADILCETCVQSEACSSMFTFASRGDEIDFAASTTETFPKIGDDPRWVAIFESGTIHLSYSTVREVICVVDDPESDSE